MVRYLIAFIWSCKQAEISNGSETGGQLEVQYTGGAVRLFREGDFASARTRL